MLRGPQQIRVGKRVVIDDYATLDSREDFSGATETVAERGIDIGDHSFVGKHTMMLAKPGSIHLGRACNISSHCRIATQTTVTVGESVLIAAYVYIGPGNHNIGDADRPIMEQGMQKQGGVHIGDNVWIGTRATILDGVSIGSGAVVGAHSLVTSDVPENAIVAGVPAKVIRYRE